MKSFKEYLNEAKGFKKERNPGTNSGAGTRGRVQFDITAPNEKLADKMEAALIELGFDSAEYGEDMGNEGYLFAMMIDSNEMKEFNREYNRLKKELK